MVISHLLAHYTWFMDSPQHCREKVKGIQFLPQRVFLFELQALNPHMGLAFTSGLLILLQKKMAALLCEFT